MIDVPAITRFTTLYNADEDRIALNCETVSGDVFCLWLTRRLADQALGVVLKIAEKIDPGPSVPPAAETLWRANVQSAVQSEMGGVPPVARPGPVPGYVLKTIQFSLKDNVLHISFTPKHGPSSTLGLSMPQLLQWLKVLFDNYRAADWRFDGWPEWFLEINEPRAIAMGSVLH